MKQLKDGFAVKMNNAAADARAELALEHKRHADELAQANEKLQRLPPTLRMPGRLMPQHARCNSLSATTCCAEDPDLV